MAEALRHKIAAVIVNEMRTLGPAGIRCPRSGRDKQFMGGYRANGVDTYSDEEHGLILSSGVKGLLDDPRKKEPLQR